MVNDLDPAQELAALAKSLLAILNTSESEGEIRSTLRTIAEKFERAGKHGAKLVFEPDPNVGITEQMLERCRIVLGLYPTLHEMLQLAVNLELKARIQQEREAEKSKGEKP